MESRQKEWRQLQAAALLRLEQPYKYLDGDTAKLKPILRLWQYPAFAEQTSFVVYRSAPTSPAQNKLQEIVWNRESDNKRITDPMTGIRNPLGFAPVPSINERFIDIPEFEIRSRIELLSKLVFPPFLRNRPWGLDGQTAGLELFETGGNSRLEWWGDGPTEWIQLADWVDVTSQWFRHLLEEQA